MVAPSTAGAVLLGTTVLLSVAAANREPSDDEEPGAWRQWGGPSQDFVAPAEISRESWPEDGPQRLWSRSLGDGFSAILFDSGRLFTMAKAGAEEAVLCLSAKSGATIWEYRYEHDRYRGHAGYGDGPRSTPLLADGLLFTVGVTGKMHALDAKTGRVLWSRELWGKDFRGNRLGHGYSSSPVGYDDMVIVPAGGEAASLVAFEATTGEVRWRALGFDNSYSSPLVVELLDRDQLLVFMAGELIGVDPNNGELLWRYPHENQWKHNISLPLVVDGRTLFLSSPQAGARGIRLSEGEVAIEVEELWSARRMQLYHATAVRQGDWVYGSSGVSVAFMAAVNVWTGEIAWRQRGFARANTVAADGKLVILEEDGLLSIATPTTNGLLLHARVRLFAGTAWTVPTIVGDTLYARNRTEILALSLG